MSSTIYQEGRIHPSAMIIKMLVNTLNTQPDLSSSTTAIASLAESISESQIVSRPHRLSSYGHSLISLQSVSEEVECSICQENLINIALNLPCGHNFHKKCIKKWFLSHSTCPVCRMNIDYF